jgi:hypothetical protein
MSAAVLDLALRLVAEGKACFFCHEDKTPACPHGFRDAARDAVALRDLHRRHPGPLIGVAAGEVSGIGFLDIDRKHEEAVRWWLENRHRMPQTRVHRTRSGGLHVVFCHYSGMRCWAARPVVGVDGRADGGYVVWWPAAGLSVLCDAPPAPWPEWLLEAVSPAPISPRPMSWQTPQEIDDRYVAAALRSAIDRVSRAGEGIRNSTLNSEAYGLTRFVEAGVLDAQQVADALAEAAISAGLAPRETMTTLHSAFRARGVA